MERIDVGVAGVFSRKEYGVYTVPGAAPKHVCGAAVLAAIESHDLPWSEVTEPFTVRFLDRGVSYTVEIAVGNAEIEVRKDVRIPAPPGRGGL